MIQARKLDSSTFPSAQFGTGSTLTAGCDGVLIILATYQMEYVTGNSNYKITISGASGGVVNPQSTQYSGSNSYTRGTAFAFAGVSEGDSITIGSTRSNTTLNNLAWVLIPSKI